MEMASDGLQELRRPLGRRANRQEPHR
jgi:transposase